MLVVSPSPILLTIPCAIISLPSKMALHICDGWFPNSASRSEQFGKYAAFKMQPLRDSGSVKSLHDCLAKRARLKSSRSLNPRPPICFGLVMTSHETQAGFLLPLLLPH